MARRRIRKEERIHRKKTDEAWAVTREKKAEEARFLGPVGGVGRRKRFNQLQIRLSEAELAKFNQWKTRLRLTSTDMLLYVMHDFMDKHEEEINEQRKKKAIQDLGQ